MTDGVEQVFTWEEGARIEVKNLRSTVVVEVNAEGFRTLAGHLLAPAKDGCPDRSHLHLEDGNGPEEGSAELVLERSDDEA
ncbi:hypothetical protein ACIRJL_45745 [Streptomyces sp. NPDC102383]|uniref:Imm32 family immunity protein n=1 Tax=Streptomyces sp. NPDC102383 TaxID=3366165 RepID=UPI0037F944C1